eukprot:729937-Alexandrium_andersonii.AAC.1
MSSVSFVGGLSWTIAERTSETLGPASRMSKTLPKDSATSGWKPSSLCPAELPAWFAVSSTLSSSSPSLFWPLRSGSSARTSKLWIL